MNKNTNVMYRYYPTPMRVISLPLVMQVKCVGVSIVVLATSGSATLQLACRY